MMPAPSIQVLLLENDPGFARLLRHNLAAFTSSRIDLRHCRKLAVGLEFLKANHVDAILLDLQLPDGQGIGAFKRLQEEAANLPVIILADFDSETLALRAVREGAQDYLVKSRFEGRVLSRVIRYAIERKETERRLSTQCAVTQLLAESPDLDTAAPRILQAACEHLGWELGAVWTVDAHAEVLRCRATWCRPSSAAAGFATVLKEAEMPKKDGLCGRVWNGKEPAWSVALAAADFPGTKTAIAAGLGTAFAVPISVDLQVLGLIGFFGRAGCDSDQVLLQMMATMGAQIGQFMLRKQVEADLAEKHNLLRTLIDTLPDAIYVKDSESRFVLANVGVAQLMGAAKPEDLYGRRDSDYYPKELADQYYSDERVLLASGRPLINREEPVVDSQGHWGWLLTTKAPLRDLQGRITGLVGIGRNITARKEEEERHRQTEARLQAILDNTTAVIYLKDQEGRYLLINRQFETLFRLNSEQVLGRTDFDIFPAESAARLRANDNQVLTSRRAGEFEEVVPLGNEPRTYISVKFPLRNNLDETIAVCGISTDISERKQAENQLVQANLDLVGANHELSRSEEALRIALSQLRASHTELKAAQLRLIQAEKLESIGTLAAGVAHEVKNPLQTILMGVQYLNRRLNGDEPEMKMVLSEIIDAIRRADSIVRELVQFAGARTLQIEPEDLNAVIEQSLALAKYELTKGHVTVNKDLSSELPHLPMERNKIQQAFLNLFLNAVQAMPDGGTMTVRTYRGPRTTSSADGAPVSVNPPPEPAAVVAEVEDTGKGIPDQILNRVFDPFFTTKPMGTGTGLGLPVTRKIIELHGGSIEVSNRPGGGACFLVKLNLQTKGDHEPEKNTHCG